MGQQRHDELPYVSNYHCAAPDLPTPIMDCAYAIGDLPVQIDIPELNIVQVATK